jgi:hypothetical protein
VKEVKPCEGWLLRRAMLSNYITDILYYPFNYWYSYGVSHLLIAG